MLFYVVPQIVDEEGSITAKVPDGVIWVGCPHEGTYLIKTMVEVPGSTPLDDEALVSECLMRGLDPAVVKQVWEVGGGV